MQLLIFNNDVIVIVAILHVRLPAAHASLLFRLIMVANNNLIVTDRKLPELLGMSSMSPNHTENCDLTELSFYSLFHSVSECQYFDLPFNDPTSSIHNIKNTISHLHVTIRSLNKQERFDALYEFLTLLPFTPDIVCVSETRLKADPLINIAILNYNFVNADSVTNAGGVRVYVPSKFKFQVDHELILNLNGCEEIWLNLVTEKNHSTKITIGAMYRHANARSSHDEEFFEALCNTINNITKRNGTFYLLGDINIDLNVDKRSMGRSLYLEHLTSCDSLSIITIPTRVTKNSSTITDHTKTNDYGHIIKPGVIRCGNE